MKQLFIFAGEPSGDLHGAHLIKALRESLPECHISGVGGPEMRAQNIKSFLNMEDFAVMGFSDVFRSFPKLYKQFKKIRDFILEIKPDAVIFIDYPGFNLRMAKALRKKDFQGKLIHYICPSVWAWGKKRIQHMAETLDLLLTIYPFEAQHFNQTSLPVKYIGNPLQEYIQKHSYQHNWKQELDLPQHGNLIAIFPGSRKGEIRRNLPKQLEAAQHLLKDDPSVCFGISCAHEEIAQIIEEVLSSFSLKLNTNFFIIPKKYSYELMRDCHSAIAKSGTVTLELALHGRPTVVVYELSWMNYLIAKCLIRLNLPHYCIVNILIGKTVFPELIERGFTGPNLYSHLKAIHETGEARNNCLSECQKIPKLLQNHQASTQAAIAIKELLS